MAAAGHEGRQRSHYVDDVQQREGFEIPQCGGFSLCEIQTHLEGDGGVKKFKSLGLYFVLS